MSKQNWFDTLNQALEAENLVEFWPLWLNLGYGESHSFTVETQAAEGRKKAKYRHISIYRNENGRYERPVTYSC